MAPPRVLLCGRPDLLAKPGGDTRQILALQRCLGARSGLSLELRPDLRGYDLVHVFNLSRPLEPYLQATHAHRAGVPVVCSPIFQDLREYNRRGRRGAGRVLFCALGESDSRLEDARAVANLLRAGRGALRCARLGARLAASALVGGGVAVALQRELLEQSRAVVYNSTLEAERVHEVVHRPSPRTLEATVPVGVDAGAARPVTAGEFAHRFGVERFVLCLARLEDLKNQLALVAALQRDPLPLVLIGNVNRLHRAYVRAVTRAAARRPRTLLLADLARPWALAALAAAAVHVFPSWFETAGLVSLEAAAAGCAVVSTDRGYARALLGDQAVYCDPGDARSIREAVHEALRRGPSAELHRRVLADFTDERVAAATSSIYERACA
jgi:glycosyltransferase involved in cell wall biosynthesis